MHIGNVNTQFDPSETAVDMRSETEAWIIQYGWLNVYQYIDTVKTAGLGWTLGTRNLLVVASGSGEPLYLFIYFGLHSLIKFLAEQRKPEKHLLAYHRPYMYVWYQYADHFSIFPGGSENQGRVVAAAIWVGYKLGARIPDQSSIFIVEADAHFPVHDCIKNSDRTNVVVYSKINFMWACGWKS